jgi:hypothetical protein
VSVHQQLGLGLQIAVAGGSIEELLQCARLARNLLAAFKTGKPARSRLSPHLVWQNEMMQGTGS